tara:strand:+ start:2386 stop:2796 length:411 start_codon:yes stop_codon:yes gene_type:complete
MGVQSVFAIEISLLILMQLLLSINVVRLRRKYKISLKDSGNIYLIRAIRAQANFIEYVPIILVAHLSLVLFDINFILFSILASLMIVGRVLHIFSIIYIESKEPPIFIFRAIAMVCTFASMLLSSIALLIISWMNF